MDEPLEPLAPKTKKKRTGKAAQKSTPHTIAITDVSKGRFAVWIIGGACLFSLALAALFFRQNIVKIIGNQSQPPLATANIEGHTCDRPASLAALSKRDLDVTAISLGKITVGSFHGHEQPQIFKLLSDSANDDLVIAYLVCEAAERGEIRKDSVAQADYLRLFWAYMRTKPTADQLSEWMDKHKMPLDTLAPTPESFNTPDFEPAEPDPAYNVSFVMPQVQVNQFRIMNLGAVPFQFWAERFPVNVFFTEPELVDAIPAQPKVMKRIRIFALATPEAMTGGEFDLMTDIPQPTSTAQSGQSPLREKETYGRTVHLSYADTQAFRNCLENLSRAAQQELLRAVQSGAIHKNQASLRRANYFGIAAANAGPSSDGRMATAETDVLVSAVSRAVLPYVDNDEGVAAYYAAVLFDNFNWPELSAAAYARLLKSDSLLTGSVTRLRSSRAVYLDGEIATEDQRHRVARLAVTVDDESQAAKTYEIMDGASHWRVASLLTTRSMRADSESLAQALQASPKTRALGESLLGDLYSVSQEQTIACDHYQQAAQVRMTPSLASRGIYTCVDSGRAKNMYDALESLLKEDPTHWVTNKLFAPIVDYVHDAKRSAILIEGWNVSRWLATLQAHWKQVPGTLPAQFAISLSAESFCSSQGVMTTDVKFDLVPVSSMNESLCSADNTGQVATYLIGYQVAGLQFTGHSDKPPDQLFVYLLRQLATSDLSYPQQTGPQMSIEWARSLTFRYRNAICGEPQRNDLHATFSRDLCIRRLAAVFLFKLFRPHGFDIVEVSPTEPDLSRFSPIEGRSLNAENVGSGAYPWLLAVRASVKSSQIEYNDAIGTFRYFLASRYAREDGDGHSAIWQPNEQP